MVSAMSIWLNGLDTHFGIVPGNLRVTSHIVQKYYQLLRSDGVYSSEDMAALRGGLMLGL